MNSTFTKILSLVLAIILIFFGLNKFIQFDFLPLPPVPEEATSFMKSLSATGYLLQVVGAFEIFIGILLLFRKWVPFALLLLVPISFNIILFHLFLNMTGILPAILTALINVILIFKYWKAYRPLFQ